MAQIDKSNLIVLPEMFTSGFTMQATQVADVANGEVLQWMQSMAFKKQAVITGSTVIEEDFNKLSPAFKQLIENIRERRSLEK